MLELEIPCQNLICNNIRIPTGLSPIKAFSVGLNSDLDGRIHQPWKMSQKSLHIFLAVSNTKYGILLNQSTSLFWIRPINSR